MAIVAHADGADLRLGVVLGGTWPNLIDGFVGVKGELPGIPPSVRVCARVDAGRLVLSVK